MEKDSNTIVLNENNSYEILFQYIELAQQKGAFILSEADLLKRSSDVLINKGNDEQITPDVAKQLFFQAVQKGQRHGAYSLNDAALLHNVITYLNNNNSNSDINSNNNDNSVKPQASAPPTLVHKPSPVPSPVPAPVPAPVPVPAPAPVPVPVKDEFDDLSDLAEPIPLRPTEI